MSGSIKPCLFCGATGRKMTNEDVYPKWLLEYLNIKAPVTLFVGADHQPIRTMQKVEVKLRDVCCACNSGWMSTLEGQFKARLGPSLKGAPAELDATGRLIAATWATKQWFLLERAIAYGRNSRSLEVPPQYFRWLAEHQSPPPHTQVWIGAITAAQDHLFSILSTQPVAREGEDAPYGAAGVFSIAHLLFQVHIPIQGPFFTTLKVGRGLVHWLIPIWPDKDVVGVGIVKWPPVGILTQAQFERIWPDWGVIRPHE